MTNEQHITYWNLDLGVLFHFNFHQTSKGNVFLLVLNSSPQPSLLFLSPFNCSSLTGPPAFSSPKSVFRLSPALFMPSDRSAAVYPSKFIDSSSLVHHCKFQGSVFEVMSIKKLSANEYRKCSVLLLIKRNSSNAFRVIDIYEFRLDLQKALTLWWL